MIILNAEPTGYASEARDLLASVGEVIELACDRSSLMQNLPGVDILIVRLGLMIDATVLACADRLKVIISATTGLNHIDLRAAQEKGIKVMSLRGERAFLDSVTATAEHTWGLMLALIRHLVPAYESVRDGDWNRDRFKGTQLSGKTLGIIGYGRLGKIVSQYANAFRMSVLYNDPNVSDTDEWAQKVTLPELLANSDVVSLHASYSQQTHHMIGRDAFSQMKTTACFINTARGELVDETALLHSLKQGEIAGAAIDVLENETHGETQTWLKHPLLSFARESHKLIVTPHIGGATVDSMQNAEIFMARKLVSFIHEHST